MATITCHQDSRFLSMYLGANYNNTKLVFYLNGSKVVIANPDPRSTLLDYIRSQYDLKGTKLGCGEGGCGACTVVLQKVDAQRKRVRHLAINACLFPLIGVDGKHIITIEGLGTAKEPHPLQERMAKLHGSQCGFCTPGIIMSLYALIRNSYDPETKEFRLSVRDIELEGHLDGNLCRCTGYKPILDAAKTFITEDIGGQILQENLETPFTALSEHMSPNYMESSCSTLSSGSCGRPGGCCKDSPSGPSYRPSYNTSSETTNIHTPQSDYDMISITGDVSPISNNDMPRIVNQRSMGLDLSPLGDSGRSLLKTKLEAITLGSKNVIPTNVFPSYMPGTELIFPPALWKHRRTPLFFGSEAFIWIRPTTVEEVLNLKSIYPKARLVCGGSEVQLETRSAVSEVTVLIYVADIEELSVIHLPASVVEVNGSKEFVLPANASLTAIEDVCKYLYTKIGLRHAFLGALCRQSRYFAGRQIKNVASLAGNLATASPISDMNALFMVSGASLTIESKRSGRESISIDNLFPAYRATNLPKDAIITEIRVPLEPPGSKLCIKAYKQSKRKSDDIAVVNAAFHLTLGNDGEVHNFRVAYGGLGPVILELESFAERIKGRPWFNNDVLQLGLQTLLSEVDLPYEAPGGMVPYRRTLALSFFLRFWHESALELGLGTVDSEKIQEIERSISAGNRRIGTVGLSRIVGQSIPHLSSLKQCTGEAIYIDDMPNQDRQLFCKPVLSDHAHARLVNVDWSSATTMKGVRGYVDRHSIPRESNIWGPIVKDEPLFAEDRVFAHGQVIGLVYADTSQEADAAAKAVKVVYELATPILSIGDAMEANSFFDYGKELRKGAAIIDEMEAIFSDCEHVISGVTSMGGQEHFYLETNAAVVIPNAEDDSFEVWSSTQNTLETQEFVSQVTGVPSNRVNVRVRRMGGAFGGKESRSVPIACLLAVAAKKERRPMRMMLNRDEDMMMSGQRHPFRAYWKVGVSTDGRIIALDADLYNNAGWSLDMSSAVMDRCCTHLDNCYNIPNTWIRGHVCKTNIHSNTAFRGFGGPQAMFITEQIICAISDRLGLDVDDLRSRNLYRVGDRTPYLQEIDEDWHIPGMLKQLRASAEYDYRKQEVVEFNKINKWKKRGIALIPTKFGLSFATATHLNQASAYVRIYTDGSVLLSHGGTEMGQGLYTKMCQVAAEALNVPLEAVYTQDSQTYQIANASPTAASAGSDLNGMAIKNACEQLNKRLEPYRKIHGDDMPIRKLAQLAYRDRVDLSAHGFWKMPKVGYQWGNYDQDTVKPMYYYFTQGVATSEVELDLLTGDHTVRRTDILMDVGQSINPALDFGQIEGAFVQGLGLFTIEESLWSPSGTLLTKGPSTYKIPAFSNIPEEFNVALLCEDENGKPINWSQLGSIHSSKGIGEPPLFLGSSVFFALRMAVKAAREMNGLRCDGLTSFLESPATAEKLRLAVGDVLAERGSCQSKGLEPETILRIS